MKNLQVFKNEQFGEVRVMEHDGEPWFVGKDVAGILGYADQNKAIATHVDTEDKLNDKTSSSLGQRGGWLINESGLYSLILSSKLPAAKKFKRWVTAEVLPSIRKHGFYETPRAEAQNERLASVNNAVKILTPLLQAAGCNSEIQLLTEKSIYEKAGIVLPVTIHADQQYFDTVHIARQVGIYYQSSGKPADKPVNEIIRRLDISESLYTETWESKGKWQGTVRKYAPQVIDMVKAWCYENGYPREIQYVQSDGQIKFYHVNFKNVEVA